MPKDVTNKMRIIFSLLDLVDAVMLEYGTRADIEGQTIDEFLLEVQSFRESIKGTAQ